jgi:hypothetical protein
MPDNVLKDGVVPIGTVVGTVVTVALALLARARSVRKKRQRADDDLPYMQFQNQQRTISAALVAFRPSDPRSTSGPNAR